MIRLVTRCLGIALMCTLVMVTPARAELGDYTLLRTLRNLVDPPEADNPVTPGQALTEWPLLGNPELTFDDGFDPARYLEWQTVQLHSSTGSVCGNNTPYKFFVNRAPNSSNMVIYMEGGGACWDYESCVGGSLLGARNPDGIPDDYMSLENPSASLVSPFVFRYHPYSRTKVQNWTMVYVPYCTGDIYTGDTLGEYPTPTGDTLHWQHNGLRNVRAVIAWLKNNLERPAQMLSTGCSAGGAGSLANYFHLRRDMQPDLGFLLDDSGPIFPAASGDATGSDISSPLHDDIRQKWGLDDDGNEWNTSPIAYMAQQMAPDFDVSDMGSMYRALSRRFPGDRMGHTHFWQDYNYSRYSYERFYDFISDESDPALKEAFTHILWYLDTASLAGELADLENFGLWVPYSRALNDSHCSTIVDFEHGDIQEAGLELRDFINDLLDGNGPVRTGVESDWNADPLKPVPLIYWLVDSLL